MEAKKKKKKERKFPGHNNLKSKNKHYIKQEVTSKKSRGYHQSRKKVRYLINTERQRTI